MKRKRWGIRSHRLVPMEILLGLTAGIVLATLLVRWAQQRDVTAQHRIFGAGLVVAALIYVGLAAFRGAGPTLLAYEAGGVALFGGLAILGRRYAAVLAGGWAAHVLWDVLLHLGTQPGAAYTPQWYPWLCVSFDLILAGTILRNDRAVRRLGSNA